MDDASTVGTFLFTDIEGSSRLWEREPARMQVALARHDALARGAVADHRGSIVKMTGDGMCAVFQDPRGAIDATLAFLRGLAALRRVTLPSSSRPAAAFTSVRPSSATTITSARP